MAALTCHLFCVQASPAIEETGSWYAQRLPSRAVDDRNPGLGVTTEAETLAGVVERCAEAGRRAQAGGGR